MIFMYLDVRDDERFVRNFLELYRFEYQPVSRGKHLHNNIGIAVRFPKTVPILRIRDVKISRTVSYLRTEHIIFVEERVEIDCCYRKPLNAVAC